MADRAPLLPRDDEKRKVARRFSDSTESPPQPPPSRQQQQQSGSNTRDHADIEDGGGGGVGGGGVGGRLPRGFQHSTPDVKRRVVAEFRGEGAGFMTPRSRFRSKTKTCCGINLVNNPSFGTLLNLTSCFIGGGVMSVPLAYQYAGIIPGMCVTVLCACCTALSLYFIATVAELADPNEVTDSFAGLAVVFGRRWVKPVMLAMDTIAAAVLLGVICGAQIIIKDNIKGIVQGLSAAGDDQLGVPEWAPMAAVTALIIAPLATLRKLDFLKYSSAMAITSMLYVIALIITKGARTGGELQPSPGHEPGSAQPDYAAFSWSEPKGIVQFMRAMPMIVFCFGCQPQVPPLYAELQRKADVSRRKGSAARLRGFALIIAGSVGTFGVLVVAMGTFGVLAFPNELLPYHAKFVLGDILSVFDPASRSAVVARFSLTLALALMTPLLIWPVRVSLWTFIQRLGLVATAEKGATMPQLQFISLSYTVLIITTTCAAALDNLGMVFGLLGSVGGSTLFYIYPAAAFMALVRRSEAPGNTKHAPVVSEGRRCVWLGVAWALLVYGVCVLFVGCYSTLAG